MNAPIRIDLPRAHMLPPEQELAGCLLAPQANIPSKFLYDALGSRLFEAITELAEYYPTRLESSILAQHGAEIFGGLRPDLPLVEPGAGSCRKAAQVLAHLRAACFVALEIDADFALQGLGRLQQAYPELPLLAVSTDFSEQVRLPQSLSGRPCNLFYPGSSIGNFEPPRTGRMLRSLFEACQGGGLVIGVDLVKPAAMLEAAYDDVLGVTAAFNLNLLRQANRLLGSDFDPREWRHCAFWNASDSRIEMHLEARRAVTVRWGTQTRSFAAGERIHTENSCKWTPADFRGLLFEAGFRQVECWTDPRAWFAVFRAC